MRVIWSFEHQRWWAPFERGYVTNIEDAGRYSDADANRIVRNANAFGGRYDPKTGEKLTDRSGVEEASFEIEGNNANR